MRRYGDVEGVSGADQSTEFWKSEEGRDLVCVLVEVESARAE